MYVYVYVDDGEMVKDREDGDGQGSLACLSLRVTKSQTRLSD